MNLLIIRGFRAMVPRTANPRGFLEFQPGMVVTADGIPVDQSADDWIAKGLAKDTSPPAGEPTP